MSAQQPKNVASGDGMMLYGAKAIADYLGIRPRQALHLIEQGHLPHFRVGRALCANRSTLNAWLAEREAAARAQASPNAR